MPVLDNPRHERFAQCLSQGMSATQAYIEAGYRPNDGNAATLKGNQRILERLAELQNTAAERAAVTLESLLTEAEEARLLAMKIEQPSAAVAAIKEKGILAGVRVEKRQNTNINPNELSDDDLAAIATGSGEDAASASGRSGKPH